MPLQMYVLNYNIVWAGGLILRNKIMLYYVMLFNLFRIALWPSVGKDQSPRLFTCAVFILVPS